MFNCSYRSGEYYKYITMVSGREAFKKLVGGSIHYIILL